MKNLSSVIILTLSLLFSGITIAEEPQLCGFTQECPDGLACVGAIGSNNNGICVMTGPQIVLCKTVKYFDDKLASIFAIFAVVMIGIAFFLGKISWGMIVSVLIGIGIIKGATTIIKKVSGDDEGYCSSTAINYSAVTNAGDVECFEDITVKLDTKKVYNLQKIYEGVCTEPLTCIKKICTAPNISGEHYITINDVHTNILYTQTAQTFVPEQNATIVITTCTKTAYQTDPSICNKAVANCIDLEKDTKRDFLYCKNTCNGTNFADSYSVGGYANCKEIASAGK